MVGAWTLIVVAVSVLPGSAVGGPGFPGADKVGHFFLYAIMAFAAHNAARRPCLSCGVLVTAACGLVGAATEVAQNFVPERDMSLLDELANIAGAAAASLVYVRWLGRK